MAAPRIYLDHAATAPLLPAARAAMADALGRWANPSSPHGEGRRARAALEEARDRIRTALGWPHSLIFTSGATEALGIALDRLAPSPHGAPRPAIASAVEHQAVLRQRPDARIVGVGADGLIDPAGLAAMLAALPGALVAVQQVNSETGIVQPLAAIGEVVRRAGGLLLVDAAQGAGKLALPEADLVAISAHKLGGPPGVGALLVRDPASLVPDGGGQEQGYRMGTENLPAILGFAAAVAAMPMPARGAPPPAWMTERRQWRTDLDDAVAAAGGEPVGGHILAGAPRSPLIGSYRLPGAAAQTQLIRLDLGGFAVSAGSACSSGSLRPSHVMQALGFDDRAAHEVIRVSFGHDTRRDEVDRFIAAYRALAGARRAA